MVVVAQRGRKRKRERQLLFERGRTEDMLWRPAVLRGVRTKKIDAHVWKERNSAE